MKLYKSFLFSALAAVAALATSCSDEGQWDAYSPKGEVYSFAQSANTYSYLPSDEIPDTFELKIYRNTTAGEKQLSLIVDYSGNVFSASDSVVFANGSNQATCYVTFKGTPTMGASENMTIMIDTLATISDGGNAAMTFSFSLDYTWLSAGSCNFISDWDQNQAKVAIQKAKEYDGNLYRIVSPYYYVAPDYCPNPGYHLQFYLDENNEPLGLPSMQNIGEAASAGGYWNLYFNPAHPNFGADCTFTREGTMFTIKGLWASGDETLGYTPTYYATEAFDWNEGCPCAN